MRAAPHATVRADRIEEYDAAHARSHPNRPRSSAPWAPRPGPSGAAAPICSLHWSAKSPTDTPPVLLTAVLALFALTAENKILSIVLLLLMGGIGIATAPGCNCGP